MAEAGLTEGEAERVVAGVLSDPKLAKHRAVSVAQLPAPAPGGQTWWITGGQPAKGTVTGWRPGPRG